MIAYCRSSFSCLIRFLCIFFLISQHPTKIQGVMQTINAPKMTSMTKVVMVPTELGSFSSTTVTVGSSGRVITTCSSSMMKISSSTVSNSLRTSHSSRKSYSVGYSSRKYAPPLNELIWPILFIQRNCSFLNSSWLNLTLLR